MFGVKFVTESSRKSFNFESVRRDLVLLLINFMDENAYLHVYVVSKRYTYNSVPSWGFGGLRPPNKAPSPQIKL